MEKKKTHIGTGALLLVAAALLALLPMPQSQNNFDLFKGQYGGQFQNQMEGSWYIFAGIAIAICIFFNTLVYMIGEALSAENLKKYAKAEFMQTTASSMMIFFAVALIYGLSTGSGFDLFRDVIGSDSVIPCAAESGGTYFIWNTDSRFGSGPLGAFKCKLQERITALDAAYGNVYNSNLPNERMTSTCIMMFGTPVYCGDWIFSQHNKVEEAHLLCTKIVGLLMPLHAQYVLAEYIQKNMLSVFLPLGLMLRIFPLTRGVGGLFIAMGIGFFFIFPAFYLLTDPTFVKIDKKTGGSSMQEGVCYTGFKGSAVVLQNIVAPTVGAGQSEQLAVGNAKMLVFQLSVSILFYPFVALVLTLIFIRAMTPLLGGDTGELMKMVARLG